MLGQNGWLPVYCFREPTSHQCDDTVKPARQRVVPPIHRIGPSLTTRCTGEEMGLRRDPEKRRTSRGRRARRTPAWGPNNVDPRAVPSLGEAGVRKAEDKISALDFVE